MGPNYVLDKGFIANSAVVQFHAVKLAADDQVTAVTAAGEQAIGVCQEEITAGDATSGRVTDVRILGISRVVAGAAVTRGALVRVNAAGRAIALAGTAGVNENVLGMALTPATADGEHIDVLLTPGGRSNAAAS
jgi:hypothetical protein